VLLFEPVEDEGHVRGLAEHPSGQFTRGDWVGEFTQRDDLRCSETELVSDAARVGIKVVGDLMHQLAHVAIHLDVGRRIRLACHTPSIAAVLQSMIVLVFIIQT
jgi:hypothetical protein